MGNLDKHTTKRMVQFFCIEDLKKFIVAQKKIPCDIDVHAGHSYIDGASLVGLLTLDLSSPLEVILYTVDKDEIEYIDRILEPFSVKM